MKKVFLILIASFILLSVLACIFLYNLGGKLIEAGIESELEAALAENGISDVQSDINEDWSSNIQEDNEISQQPDVPQENGPGLEEPSADQTGTSAPSTGQAGNAPGDAPAKPKPSSPKPVKEEKKITAEKLNEIKDQVTAPDKITAAALVMKRLTPSDINNLKSMLAGGLTEEKIAKAKNLVYAKFTPAEVEQIKEIYHKYMAEK